MCVCVCVKVRVKVPSILNHVIDGKEELASQFGFTLRMGRRRQVAGSCECGDEPSGSTKCGEFLE